MRWSKWHSSVVATLLMLLLAALTVYSFQSFDNPAHTTFDVLNFGIDANSVEKNKKPKILTGLTLNWAPYLDMDK